MLEPKTFNFFSPTGGVKTISPLVEQNPGYHHLEANVITTSIGGGLSIIGVIFIVVSYFKLVKYRAGGTTAQTILLFISAGKIFLVNKCVHYVLRAKLDLMRVKFLATFPCVKYASYLRFFST